MRMFATHDEAGTITRLVLAPHDGPVATVVPEPGHTVSEVAIPELDLDFADPLLVVHPSVEERLLAVIAQFHVARDEGTGRATLTRTRGPGAG